MRNMCVGTTWIRIIFVENVQLGLDFKFVGKSAGVKDLTNPKMTWIRI